MPIARCNGIDIAYRCDGPADGAPLLLVHGVGAQLVRWPERFVSGLGDRGFRVIRFDNRDCGLSTHLHGAAVPDLRAVLDARARGATPDTPYTLSDMARDAAGLLDALGIDSAHVLGVSLGGMVAQVLAIEHSARVRSLAIVMSHSGNPALSPPGAAALSMLAATPPDPALDPDGFLDHAVALNRALGSPDHPTPEPELRVVAALSASRAHDPAGTARQFAASRAAPDRRDALRLLVVPTLVIHGAADPLIPADGGIELAELIPGAWLLKPGGMGHDLPEPLFPLLLGAIGANAARADTGAADVLRANASGPHARPAATPTATSPTPG